MAPSHSHPEKVTRTINHGHSSARGHARILHTSDWQLGMERWFLKKDKNTANDGSIPSCQSEVWRMRA